MWAMAVAMGCAAVGASAMGGGEGEEANSRIYPGWSGETFNEAGCAACHHPEGRGAGSERVGLDGPLPDFSSPHLERNAARLELVDLTFSSGVLDLTTKVRNLAGHKFPTASPAHRLWLHVRITNDAGDLKFESGAPADTGAIVGNDSDSDPTTFERHHDIITQPTHVQVYEAVMVDAQGRVTTNPLRGVRYIKDNRLLPQGFDKESVDASVAVRGAAADDPNFLAAMDLTRYTLVMPDDVSGSVHVEVELLYQPVAYTWARSATRRGALPARLRDSRARRAEEISIVASASAVVQETEEPDE